QPAGADQPGGAKTNARGGCIPRWAVGADAGGGPPAPHRRDALGHAKVSGHEEARGDESRAGTGVSRGRLSRVRLLSCLRLRLRHDSRRSSSGEALNQCAQLDGHYPESEIATPPSPTPFLSDLPFPAPPNR